MLQLILNLMLQLHPRQPAEARHYVAREISLSAHSRDDARLLVAVRLHEDGFNPRAIYPFGITCCVERVHEAGDASRIALHILHTGRARCRSLAGALHYFNTGVCTGRERGRVYAQRVLRTFNQIH